MRRIPLIFLFSSLLISPMLFASGTEVSLLGSFFPGVQIDFGDPVSNGFFLSYQNCGGGKVRAACVFPREKDSNIEVGCFLSAEADVFGNAITIASSRLTNLAAKSFGIQLIATQGLAINFLTDTENSFFVCPGLRMTIAFADFIQRESEFSSIKPFRYIDLGLCVDGGYRIWIPDGRFAIEAGLNLYWCPVLKAQFGNTTGNIFGAVGGGVFAGFCVRFGEPMPISSP